MQSESEDRRITLHGILREMLHLSLRITFVALENMQSACVLALKVVNVKETKIVCTKK